MEEYSVTVPKILRSDWMNGCTRDFNEWMEEWLTKDISINEWKSTV